MKASLHRTFGYTKSAARDCVYSKLRVTIALMLISSDYVRSTGEHLRLR